MTVISIHIVTQATFLKRSPTNFVTLYLYSRKVEYGSLANVAKNVAFWQPFFVKQHKRHIRASGILNSVQWQGLTDVSE